MNKFPYYFLLNLVLLSRKHQFDARLLDPRTFDENPFQIDDSGLNEIENPHGRQRRDPKATDFFQETPQTAQQPASYIHKAPPPQRPTIFFLSPSSNPYPQYPNSLGTPTPYGVTYPKQGPQGPNRQANAPLRKKRLPPTRQADLDADRAVRYLDYTNSQMPFNEGKTRKSFRTSNSKIAGETLGDGKLYFNMEKWYESEAKPKRLGRSRRRFELPLRYEENSYDTDDPLLEYSRVRRFLHQERAKQRAMSTTLEAKEAAMSTVLDPNLNSDGTLEPHVRKRRGKDTLTYEYLPTPATEPSTTSTTHQTLPCRPLCSSATLLSIHFLFSLLHLVTSSILV